MKQLDDCKTSGHFTARPNILWANETNASKMLDHAFELRREGETKKKTFRVDYAI